MSISYHKEMCSQKNSKNSVFIAETWRCLIVWMAINPLLLLSEPPGMSRNLILQEPDDTVRFIYPPIYSSNTRRRSSIGYRRQSKLIISEILQ